jgi:hypothetical protein
MTSSNDAPGGAAGQRGRRPPTIDLTATEVGGDSTRAGVGASPSDRLRAWIAAGSAGIPWPVVAAGGAGVLLTVAILALAGVFSGRDDGLVAVDTRLARVESQLRDGAASPMPAAGDSKVVDDLSGRLARLETIVATPRPPVADPALANRIAALEGEIKALGERVGVLGRRNDDIAAIAGEARKRADAAATAIAELKNAPAPAAAAPPAEIEALTNRLGALERIAKALESQVAARASSDVSTDRSLRLVVVANTLGAAVERGVPFAAELGAAKAIAPEPKLLAPLEPFAASGVPGTALLARELAALMPALAKSVGTTPREGGILDRLKANAERIVRVRPIDEVAGDDPSAIVRRIEIRAEQGNLVGAISEIAKLPEPSRALTKEWVARVEARNAAVEAGRKFAAAALASIAKPSL